MSSSGQMMSCWNIRTDKLHQKPLLSLLVGSEHALSRDFQDRKIGLVS